MQTSVPLITIEPTKGIEKFLQLKDLWDYRELFYFLAWRNLKVRYKQTVLGIFWALLQPLLTMIVFSLFFAKLSPESEIGIPYPLLAMSGLVLWIFFSNGVTQASNSLMGEANLIKKVYFPRVIIPTSHILSGCVDLLISLSFFSIMTFYYGIPLTLNLLFLPLIFIVLILTTLGFGLLFGALNVFYRDFRHIVTFLMQIWLFATPIAYSLLLIPKKWQALYAINPMVGIVEAFRWSVLGNEGTSPLIILLSMSIGLFVFFFSCFYFSSTEKSFADVI